MAILTIIGFALLGFVLFDIVVTTATMRGAGPLSSRMTRSVWWGALRLHRRRPSHTMLSNAGVVILGLSILVWVLLLWAGWSLVFLGSDGGIVEEDTGNRADFSAIVYYAGFTLFTLGLGDFRPVGALWQILTAVCAANGLLIITLAVTYLVPVVSAVAEKRKLAALISSLGGSPPQILRRNWNGADFDSLSQQFPQLGSLIISQSQQHLAYPILHYFHSPDPATSLPVRLAALDETLSVLEYDVEPQARPKQPTLAQMRSAIAIFLQALKAAHIEPAAAPAPPIAVPELAELPLRPQPDREEPLKGLADHRRLMLAYVENDGWSWSEVSLGDLPEVDL